MYNVHDLSMFYNVILNVHLNLNGGKVNISKMTSRLHLGFSSRCSMVQRRHLGSPICAVLLRHFLFKHGCALTDVTLCGFSTSNYLRTSLH